MREKTIPGREAMITPGNAHVGPDVHCFSIPAVGPCVGATDPCLEVCYARDYFFILPQNLRKHTRNWERSREPESFARDVITEINWKRIQILRIHVAGDFYDAAYVRSWIAIARSCRRVKFLFYTRSWQVPALLPALVELASMPNVYGFWSEDSQTGPSQVAVGRRCFLIARPGDVALVPKDVLVFRYNDHHPLKWINGSWVCAKEQGTESGVTCSTCLLCLNLKPWPVAPGDRKEK